MNQDRWRTMIPAGKEGRQQQVVAAGATLEPCPVPPVTPLPTQPVIELSPVEQLLQGLQTLVGSVIDLLTAGVHRGFLEPVTVVVDTSLPLFEVVFKPSFALHLHNDGPNTVQYRVPNIGNPGWAPLTPTEDIWIEFNRPLITAVGLTVAVGSASVRLIGKQ